LATAIASNVLDSRRPGPLEYGHKGEESTDAGWPGGLGFGSAGLST
jgi:hypothetical protein